MLQLSQRDALVRHRDTGFAHAEWANVSIGGWSVAPTIAHLRVLAATQKRLIRLHPAGIGVVNVIIGIPAPALDSAVRDESEAMIRTFAPSILAIATVVEASGFFASAVRGLLLSQRLISRVRYANDVFEHVEEVPPWMSRQLGQPPPQVSASGFLEALSAVRADLKG